MSNYKRIFEENRAVFITIVTNERKPFLTKNVELLRASFKNAKKFYDYEIIAIVVLPEHLHMIIKPKKIEEYPKITSRIKHHFSRNMDYVCENRSPSKASKREKGIWQRRYWEHTIRDENDLNKHIDYIHYNPVKHKLASTVKDWEYSSFHKFVKQGLYEHNWGKVEDIKMIIDLELG